MVIIIIGGRLWWNFLSGSLPLFEFIIAFVFVLWYYDMANKLFSLSLSLSDTNFCQSHQSCLSRDGSYGLRWTPAGDTVHGLLKIACPISLSSRRRLHMKTKLLLKIGYGYIGHKQNTKLSYRVENRASAWSIRVIIMLFSDICFFFSLVIRYVWDLLKKYMVTDACESTKTASTVVYEFFLKNPRIYPHKVYTAIN